MKAPIVLLAISTAAVAVACCGVGPLGVPVRFTGQTNIVVWDKSHGIEHFVRDARFEARGANLGFIAPTPSRPELSEADAAAFETLDALGPKPPMTKSARDAGAAATGAVSVVETKDVGGYRATVLKATDAAGLAKWLQVNGYPSPDFLPKWAAPYVERGWHFTAFKVNGKATGPVRMSFATSRPFNPYSVPEENGGGGVPLRVYYVSAGAETPKIGGKDAWVKPQWTAALPAEAAARLAAQLKLPVDAIPAQARVTRYDDPNFGRPGLDDLYFTSDDANANLAGGLMLAAVLALAASRRRRRSVFQGGPA